MQNDNGDSADSAGDFQAQCVATLRFSSTAAAEQHAVSPTTTRLALLQNGYHPVPVVRYDADMRGAGKRPVMADWVERCAVADAAEIRCWALEQSACTNTGILCGAVIGLDIDVDSTEISPQIGQLADEMLPRTPLVRVGRAPKSLRMFRADGVLKHKVTTPVMLHGSRRCCVEALAEGQQFVAFGTHPETKESYRWLGADPRDVPFADLPVLTDADLMAFLTAAETLMRDAGLVYEDKAKASARVRHSDPEDMPPRKDWEIHPTATRADVAAALAVLPPAADYDGWVRIGGAIHSALGDSGRDLWRSWSSKYGADDPAETDAKWRSFRSSPLKDIGVGTLFRAARQIGWGGPHRRAEAEPDAGTASLTPESWVYRDPATMEPRQWLVGTLLMRGAATVVAAAGGTGKTAAAVALALAYITGRHDITGQHVFQTGRAWLLTLEDDKAELERRIAAACMLHKVEPADIEGRLFVNAATDRPICFARMGEGGAFQVGVDAEALEAGIRTMGIGLVSVDPLVKSHALIENSNDHMDKLSGLFVGIASRTGCSILASSHTKKGGGDDQNANRGASALVNGFRINRVVVPMTEKEARILSIPEAEAFRHIRVVAAKQNMSVKERASWLRLESVSLGNVTDTYPSGDSVQAVAPWTPPGLISGLDAGALEAVFDRLREGAGGGWFYGGPRARHPAVAMIATTCGMAPEAAEALLTQLIDQGAVIKDQDWTTPGRNKSTRFLPDAIRAAELVEQLHPGAVFDDDDEHEGNHE